MRAEQSIRKRILAVIIAATVVICAAVVYLYVNQAYAIVADGRTIELVSSEQTAQKVMADVVNEYSPDGLQVSEFYFDEDVTIEKAGLMPKGDQVLSRKAAVADILKRNKSDDPVLTVTVKGTRGEIKEFSPQKEFEKDANMFAGTSETLSKEVPGRMVVTSEEKSVNGELVSDKEVDTTVLYEGKGEVIKRGTLGLPEGEDWKTYEGDPVFRDADELMAAAMTHRGTPYRYGGASWKTGVDCVQFVRMMYRQYGINLPNNHPGLKRVGYGVSLSKAKKGDIICYKRHVGLYLGNGKILHATSRGGVHVGKIRRGAIVTIRRVIK